MPASRGQIWRSESWQPRNKLQVIVPQSRSSWSFLSALCDISCSTGRVWRTGGMQAEGVVLSWRPILRVFLSKQSGAVSCFSLVSHVTVQILKQAGPQEYMEESKQCANTSPLWPSASLIHTWANTHTPFANAVRPKGCVKCLFYS